jgi:hypothetical protein
MYTLYYSNDYVEKTRSESYVLRAIKLARKSNDLLRVVLVKNSRETTVYEKQ